jgi:hypothetical protein
MRPVQLPTSCQQPANLGQPPAKTIISGTRTNFQLFQHVKLPHACGLILTANAIFHSLDTDKKFGYKAKYHVYFTFLGFFHHYGNLASAA